MNLEKAPDSGDVGTAPIIVGSSPQHEVTVSSGFDLSKKLQLDLTLSLRERAAGPTAFRPIRRGCSRRLAIQPAS